MVVGARWCVLAHEEPGQAGEQQQQAVAVGPDFKRGRRARADSLWCGAAGTRCSWEISIGAAVCVLEQLWWL